MDVELEDSDGLGNIAERVPSEPSPAGIPRMTAVPGGAIGQNSILDVPTNPLAHKLSWRI